MIPPIDVVPGTNPPQFAWKQVVEDLSGCRHIINHTGMLSPTVENSVQDIIRLFKMLIKNNSILESKLSMVVDRLGGEVEGKPTHHGNLLQRIDELCQKEAKLAELEKNVTPHQEPVTKKPIESHSKKRG